MKKCISKDILIPAKCMFQRVPAAAPRNEGVEEEGQRCVPLRARADCASVDGAPSCPPARPLSVLMTHELTFS